MLGKSNRSRPGTMFALAGITALGVSTFASAGSIDIFGDTANSTEGIGDFTGTLTYDFVLGDMGELTVDLTNTSELGHGGWITGLIFNFGSDDSEASAALTSATHPFRDAPGQSGAPYGNRFVGGAALDGDWLGGGSPAKGIPVGGTGSFTFDVFASDASSLTATSFLEGRFKFNFIVRFRGLMEVERGGDKVPAAEVPAPGALALLGLAGLAQRRRRRPV